MAEADFPRRRRPLLDPLREFVQEESSSGLAIAIAAVLALLWTNLPGIGGYESVFGYELTLGFGDLAVTEDVRHWVNDGLMTVFFFVVGLEIKRELVVGELADRRAAVLPALAACGGVVLPAVLFLVLTAGSPGSRGWGIPMATDIAFALGVLALLGQRVPIGAKLFLLAIAIVDDIIAIVVIALFYSDGVALGWLAAGAVGLSAVLLLRRLGVGTIWPYLAVGVVVWFCTLESGLHATIAGVALGLLTPARPVHGREVLATLEHRLHPISAFGIVPLFALANAGVEISTDAFRATGASRVAMAIGIALVLGKLVGVGGTALLVRRLGWGVLPDGVTTRYVWGLAGLAGIGFTVSIFVADLAYHDGGLTDAAKIGILGGSVVAAVVGALVLYPGTHPRPAPAARQTA